VIQLKQKKMKFCVIIFFLSFFVINFVLIQSTTLDISKFGGKPDGDIAKVWTFYVETKRN